MRKKGIWSRMKSFILKFRITRRSRWKTCMTMLWKIKCSHSTYPLSNSYLTNSLREHFSSVLSPHFADSIWLTWFNKLMNFDSKYLIVMTNSNQSSYPNNGWKSWPSILTFPVSFFWIIDLEKRGTGIYLLKESAKLQRSHKERKTF